MESYSIWNICHLNLVILLILIILKLRNTFVKRNIIYLTLEVKIIA